MKTVLSFRAMLILLVLSLTASIGFSQTEPTVGTTGPLTAFRACAFLGWNIKIRNDSDVPYTAIFAINRWADLRIVPPHRTVNAGYVLGSEIPSFHFAPSGSGPVALAASRH
jgi:hypothetical protein